jgi:polar amino acid transport system substrate-binding protein
MFLLTWILLIVLASLVHAAQVDPQKITLHYVDRPPYAISQPDSDPTGVVAEPAALVFKKAKIPFGWAKTPTNRQFKIIKEDKGLDCALGMEQTPSRLEFSKFTEPLYISQPFVAIMRPEIKEKKGITLKEMLAKYSILVKKNYTMGDNLTALVMASPKHIMTSVQSVQMVQMVAIGRGDFMMISNDEVEYYLDKGILNPKSIRIMKLADVDIRFTRRLMCSKSVDDKVIEKLNAVIKTMKVKPAPYKKLNTFE